MEEKRNLYRGVTEDGFMIHFESRIIVYYIYIYIYNKHCMYMVWRMRKLGRGGRGGGEINTGNE